MNRNKQTKQETSHEQVLIKETLSEIENDYIPDEETILDDRD